MERSFKEQLDLVRRLGVQAVQPIVIDLSVAVVDQEYNLSGNFLYVFNAPDLTSFISVKTNNSNQTAVSWVRHTGFIHPFNRLYITTPLGQTGLMTILVAGEAPELFNVIDHRSAISQGMDDLLSELRGDVTAETWGTEKTVGNAAAVEILASNASRKACIVQSKSANTGKVYIGFDNTVTTTKWIAELQAGQAYSVDDYRGAIFARADAVGQLVGFGEW